MSACKNVNQHCKSSMFINSLLALHNTFITNGKYYKICIWIFICEMLIIFRALHEHGQKACKCRLSFRSNGSKKKERTKVGYIDALQLKNQCPVNQSHARFVLFSIHRDKCIADKGGDVVKKVVVLGGAYHKNGDGIQKPLKT